MLVVRVMRLPHDYAPVEHVLYHNHIQHGELVACVGEDLCTRRSRGIVLRRCMIDISLSNTSLNENARACACALCVGLRACPTGMYNYLGNLLHSQLHLLHHPLGGETLHLAVGVVENC
jgi:hypothetical protein